MIPFQNYGKILPHISNHVQGMKQLLEKKGFLFSQDYDISNSLQKTNENITELFNPFLFNSQALPKIVLPYCGYLIKGSVEHKLIEEIDKGITEEIVIISRYGSKNSDKPQNHRGLDDKAYVSNFRETELIIIHKKEQSGC
jgi:hypothetical protein